jgi:putative restriction endonuclease
MSFDFNKDNLIRQAALRWLDDIKRKYPDGEIPARAMQTFSVPELPEEQKLIYVRSPAGNGIWKPKPMQACLSLLTVHKQNHYNDNYDPDLGVVHYSYRSQGGYTHSDNRSLRLAMEFNLPVLYFRAIDKGWYQADMVRVVDEAPDKNGVTLQVIEQMLTLNIPTDKVHDKADIPAQPSRYRTAEAQIRLHQNHFRGQVMRAYKTRCAVCRLQQRGLLDAAHIIPYAQEGESKVSNGLSLCRIHHGAYDHNILGIDQDYKIHIRRDILEEKDGPMLEHGFKEMDQEHIYQPTKKSDKPDRDNLKQRYDQFRAA